MFVFQSENACTAITWFLHLFFMATFFWMLVEGLYIAVKTRPTLHRQNIPFAVWAVIGWGKIKICCFDPRLEGSNLILRLDETYTQKSL